MAFRAVFLHIDEFAHAPLTCTLGSLRMAVSLNMDCPRVSPAGLYVRSTPAQYLKGIWVGGLKRGWVVQGWFSVSGRGGACATHTGAQTRPASIHPKLGLGPEQQTLENIKSFPVKGWLKRPIQKINCARRFIVSDIFVCVHIVHAKDCQLVRQYAAQVKWLKRIYGEPDTSANYWRSRYPFRTRVVI